MTRPRARRSIKSARPDAELQKVDLLDAPRRCRLPALALSSAVLVLAGCGTAESASTSSTSSEPTRVSASAALTSLVTTAASRTLSTGVKVSVAVGSFRGSGSFDFAAGSGSEQIDETGGVESLVFGPKTVYDRQTSGEYFVLPAGKDWVSVEPAEGGKSRTSLYILQVEDLNPQFLLSEVAWGTTSTWSLGPESVGGVATHRYVVQVAPDTVASRASGPAAAAFAATIRCERSAAGGSRAAFQDMEVWVDGHGRVAQVQATSPGSWGKTTVSVTAFGVHTRAAPPPAHTTVAIGSVMGSADSDGDSSAG